jgi:MFS family permease
VGAVAAAVVTVVLRALVRGPAALMVLAFVWGLVFAVWAVLIAPLIAGAVPEERRPAAFSVFFGCMLAVGIAGNWIGGRIPGWVHGKQAALLVAGGIVIAALIPAMRLRLPPPAPGSGRIWPRGPFLKRYLGAYAVWQLATGAFNPFASVYFARLGLTAARIGSLFSGAQVAQLGAMLAAPVVIRRFGVVRAIVWMIAGTALGLGGMAMGAGALAAAMPAYAWYMSLQWMSEPGLNTLLMNQVTEAERSGASSLNYLVGFAAQAIAAYAAGHMVAKGGYAPVLESAAAMAVVAALLFAVLIRPENPVRRSASAPE